MVVRRRVGGEICLTCCYIKEPWEDDSKSVNSSYGVHNALYFTLGSYLNSSHDETENPTLLHTGIRWAGVNLWRDCHVQRTEP